MHSGGTQRGFSLIEILIVLVIIAVFAGLMTMSVDGVQSRRGEEEVARLQRLLEMASDFSDTHGTPLALELLPNGYRFSAMQTNGEWQLLFAPSPFAERSWGEGVHVSKLELEGTVASEPWRIIFGTEPPEYRLTLSTPERSQTLVGSISGMVSVE